MTEIITIRNKNTNRKRLLNSCQTHETIRHKLTGFKFDKPKIIYEDDDIEKLKDVRKKLIPTDNTSYTIRKNKIYECRKRQNKLSVITSTIQQTINILNERGFLKDNDTNKLCSLILNEILDGSNKLNFKIYNNNI